MSHHIHQQNIFKYLTDDNNISEIDTKLISTFFDNFENFIKNTDEKNLNILFSLLNKGVGFNEHLFARNMGKLFGILLNKNNNKNKNIDMSIQGELLPNKERILILLKLNYIKKYTNSCINKINEEINTFDSPEDNLFKKQLKDMYKFGYFDDIDKQELTIESTTDISKKITIIKDKIYPIKIEIDKLINFLQEYSEKKFNPTEILEVLNKLYTYIILVDLYRMTIVTNDAHELKYNLITLKKMTANLKSKIIFDNNSHTKYDIQPMPILQKNIKNLIDKVYYYYEVNTSLKLSEIEIYEIKVYTVSIINTIIAKNIYFKDIKIKKNYFIDLIQEISEFVIKELNHRHAFRLNYLLKNFLIDNLKEDSPYNGKQQKSYSQLLYLDRTLTLFDTFKNNYKQEIVIGPIGSGKSNYVKNLTENGKTYRIVFSPSLSKDEFIGYINGGIFIPGIFTIFYTEALISFISKIVNFYYQDNPFEENLKYFLVIEEINRGYALDILDFCSNLLDRKNGFSCYPIHLNDVQKEYISSKLNIFIEQNFYDEKKVLLHKILSIFPEFSDILSHDEKNTAIDQSMNEDNKFLSTFKNNILVNQTLMLPNMNIVCTMNNYDNNIHDIDYMLFRRFSIKNIITEKIEELIFIEDLEKNQEYSWNNLILSINRKITELEGEEKCLAFYFLAGNDYLQNHDESIIKKDAIKNKLIYFLYYKVFKENQKRRDIFDGKNFNQLLNLDIKQIYEILIGKQSNLNAITRLKNE